MTRPPEPQREIREQLFNCSDVNYDVAMEQTVFGCGLVIDNAVLRGASQWGIGIVNSVHIRHHEMKHSGNDWGITFYREDDPKDSSVMVNGRCDCESVNTSD